MTDILMIEDNCELGTLVNDFLQNEGFSIEWCQDAESGLDRLDQEIFKMILLDVMLPGMDGYEACNAIRTKRSLPILMMSARTDEKSKLLGYETGADDYIDKPFAISVLTAKIKALIKRSYEHSEDHSVIVACGITLDQSARRVMQKDVIIPVNAKEFDVLCYLMKHKGEVVDKDTLFNAVWGCDCFSEPTTLNVHIRWLREKLEDDPKNPKLIQTVWRVGYRLGGD